MITPNPRGGTSPPRAPFDRGVAPRADFVALRLLPLRDRVPPEPPLERPPPDVSPPERPPPDVPLPERPPPEVPPPERPPPRELVVPVLALTVLRLEVLDRDAVDFDALDFDVRDFVFDFTALATPPDWDRVRLEPDELASELDAVERAAVATDRSSPNSDSGERTARAIRSNVHKRRDVSGRHRTSRVPPRNPRCGAARS